MSDHGTRPAYLIVDARVLDQEAITVYRELAAAAVAEYGGRYLVRGGSVDVLEGGWSPERVVIVQFDSADTARRFFESPGYQAARQAREGIAHFDMIVVEGA
ncbi:MAG: DUF1330 domain-containing protein [Rhodocyclaceae bacterium]|jgi:uncharacterized protein (DUF1330 family)|nr:DUF1330 domain-containing protein [Rhodocyclaceae bacterium]MCL4758512.1 DUF1330 domain-containing protein [Rhodocyclaceae bacterium]